MLAITLKLSAEPLVLILVMLKAGERDRAIVDVVTTRRAIHDDENVGSLAALFGTGRYVVHPNLALVDSPQHIQTSRNRDIELRAKRLVKIDDDCERLLPRSVHNY
jgi:hypothetical protein